MSRRNDNWLLVEWSAGGRDVVHVKSVLNPVIKDLKVGEVMTLSRRGEPQTATLISRASWIISYQSRDGFTSPNGLSDLTNERNTFRVLARSFTEITEEREQLSTKLPEKVAGSSPKPEEDPEPFSPSGESSWEPSDEDNASGDSDHESCKKIKLEHCRRQYINRRSSKKVLTPSHRANAVIPKIMQDANSKKNDVSRKRAHNGISRNASFNKSLPDSTKRNNTSEVGRQTVTIDVRELAEISDSFRVLFKMIDELKRPMTQSLNSPLPHVQPNLIDNISIPNEIIVRAEEECEENEEYENDEFNRSDDNVLITNKYDNQNNTTVNKTVESETKKQGESTRKTEWIPIGSGKTLIHEDQFRKVNWKSYTVATRTLLLAVFPRRILATHSLTGKPSPAFLNRPAKMCLDPKIISDVIIEIMDRFNVKENLVRGIITTKCADECKMWKQRVKKKKLSQSRSSSNQENDPPTKESFEQTNHVVN